MIELELATSQDIANELDDRGDQYILIRLGNQVDGGGLWDNVEPREAIRIMRMAADFLVQ